MLLATGFGLTACGGGGPDLSARAAEGREIARSSGCVSCHGRNGEGGVGPAWSGLAGAPVELDGGETVVADRTYLRRSIIDPQADVVAGFNVAMPLIELDDDAVDAIIAYIEELP